MVSTRTSHPRFRRDGTARKIALTDTDKAILKCIYRHRFVQADSLYSLFENRSPDRLSRRLTLLFRSGFLDRPIAQVDRYREGGSRPLVYGLGNAGARYLKETLGMPIGASDWRSRNRTYTRENLDHTLAISRFLIDLELACAKRDDVSFIPFEEILSRAPEATQRSRNPMCWQVAVQWHGARSVVSLAPDGIFGIRARSADSRTRVAYCFLEIDRGTMTIVPSEKVRESEAFPYRATVLRKLYAYADSYRLDLHKTQYDIQAPRVLFVTTSDARKRAIQKAASDLVVRSLRVPAGMFLFGSGPQDAPLQAVYVDACGKAEALAPAIIWNTETGV